MRYLAFALAFVLIQVTMPCFGKERPPEISTGMSYSEVLTRAGAPTSKNVMETKRQEEWFYNNFSVLFTEGYVSRVGGAVIKPTPLAPETSRQQDQVRQKRETPPDLLRNILKELPAPSPAAGAAPNPGTGAPLGAPPVPMDEQ